MVNKKQINTNTRVDEIMPRGSMDSVDSSATLYRKFDDEIGQLCEGFEDGVVEEYIKNDHIDVIKPAPKKQSIKKYKSTRRGIIRSFKTNERVDKENQKQSNVDDHVIKLVNKHKEEHLSSISSHKSIAKEDITDLDTGQHQKNILSEEGLVDGRENSRRILRAVVQKGEDYLDGNIKNSRELNSPYAFSQKPRKVVLSNTKEHPKVLKAIPQDVPQALDVKSAPVRKKVDLPIVNAVADKAVMYQLGKPVTVKSPVRDNIQSNYIPSKPVQAEKSTVGDLKNEQVAFFSDRNKSISYRAHKSVGSDTFSSKSEKHSFSDLSRFVREQKKQEVAKEYLNDGKIIFSSNTNKILGKQQLESVEENKNETIKSGDGSDNTEEYQQQYRELRKAVSPKKNYQKNRRGISVTASTIIASATALFILAIVGRGIDLYQVVTVSANDGFENMQIGLDHVKERDFELAQKTFRSAAYQLDRAESSFGSINSGIIAITQYIPFLSKVSAGKNAIIVGQHIARAGELLSESGSVTGNIDSVFDSNVSLLVLFKKFESNVFAAHAELSSAQKALLRIDIKNVPNDKREQFVELKKKLPIALSALDRFDEGSHVIKDLLGDNGPRKYLFLFQNNHEMRATGGFIGSYGRLDISDGKVKKFFIDGIFNPDGQLYEKVVPPRPIQKISAAWSLHDSNWFPHFPTSAEEAIVFYERTGGPTVDGVIAITPVVLQELLKVTGPIVLPEYDTEITSDNVMERLQQEVEVDYDKNENKPKKILSDLAPVMLARIFDTQDGDVLSTMSEVLGRMLVEKHIILYARNSEMEDWIVTSGWGGTIVETPRDYLSVINTNINGFKTDGVIDETITHHAEIHLDGSITDTVRIVREHTGGHTPYDWWNKVNANYMRVYVPQGSELISVSGQTREFVEPPLDYVALDFHGEPAVVEEEQSMTIDDETGTRIYTQNNKTVFANWVYVSPQEKVTIEYVYKLPFRLNLEGEDVADTYSIFFQKQLGSVGSELVSIIDIPDTIKAVWHYPKNTVGDTWKSILDTDKFRGIVIAPQE